VKLARIGPALTLLLAAWLLAGCATSTLTRLAYANAGLAYNNLVPMLTWSVDGYVDLSDAQEEWVRSRIAAHLKWHRRNELPHYGKFLEGALAKTSQPFAPDDVPPFFTSIRSHYHLLVEHTIPDVAEFFAGLSEAQATQLARRFAEDNRKFERDSLKGTPEERRRKRMHRFVDNVEMWTGSLEREQRRMISDYYESLADFSDERLGERRFVQGEIMAMVRNKPARAEMESQLKRLLVDTESWRRPEYIEKIAARNRKTFELLSALSATLTDRQRAALQERIRSLQRDVATLSAG